MTAYAAPVRDMQFLLHDVLGVTTSGVPGYDSLNPALTLAVLDAAGRLASDVLAPPERGGRPRGMPA